MPLPHHLARRVAATLVALCAIPALAATAVETRLSNFAVSYTDLDTTDAYTPAAVDWSKTEIEFGSWNFHDLQQDHFQTLAGLQGGTEQLSSAGGSATWTLRPDTLFELQAGVASTQLGQAGINGRFHTPVIVQPHTAFTVTAQFDSRIGQIWDPATLGGGSLIYAISVATEWWTTPTVGQTAYYDKAGTFQDLFSVTYRNDTDTSQQMWVSQLFGAYAHSAPVPEPSTWLMLGVGALVATRFGRRQRQA